MSLTEKDIRFLAEALKARLSEERFLHTLGVMRMAEYLAEMCAPEFVILMRAAALLHDISKEYSDEEQIRLLTESGIALDEYDLKSPQILHSYTAPITVKRDFPQYADEMLLSAVKNHTIGAPDMSVTDEIIFLADFIEDGRPYESCTQLRKFVTENMKLGNIDGNIKVLHKACAESINYTISSVLARKKLFNPKNILTRDALLAIIDRKED